MKDYRWLILIVTASLLLVGLFFSGGMVSEVVVQKALAQYSGQGYGIVTTDELMDMLKNKDFTLINVHVPYQGELPQTDVFIPYDEIDKYLDRLPADKNAKVVLYCRTDRMSTIAAKRLVELGYTNVWEMKGGMQEWRQKGYPILSASF
jgi:rhodanese-related sulfurtransferase